MIAIDLDGTLLKDDNTISTKTYNTLKKLSMEGYLITISTGRSIIGLPEVIKKMNFIDYFITSNGTSCIDKDYKCVIKNWIKYNDIKEIIADNNFMVEYLIEGKWYIQSKGIEQIQNIIDDKMIVDYILKTRKVIENEVNLEKGNVEVEKINLNFSKDNYEYALNQINSFVKKNKNIRSWTDKKHKIDLYNVFATKGNVLKQLACYANIELNEIIAFGNDTNDLEMLKFSGYSVAMKNGNDEVKKVANIISEYDNNNDGVEKFLKKFLKT